VLKKSFLDGLQGLKPHSDVGNGPLMSRLKPRPTRLTAFFSTLLISTSKKEGPRFLGGLVVFSATAQRLRALLPLSAGAADPAD
jgi:hypothetical protein